MSPTVFNELTNHYIPGIGPPAQPGGYLWELIFWGFIRGKVSIANDNVSSACIAQIVMDCVGHMLLVDDKTNKASRMKATGV